MILMGRKKQGGQALIMLVLALPLLFGMIGLGFDIGFIEMMQRRTQAAADAGALAASMGLPFGTATTSARAATALNGFTNGSNGATVTVNNPPTLGPHAGTAACGTPCQYVEVIVIQSAPTFFLRVIGVASATNVAARAVAANLGEDCLFALDPNNDSGTLALTFLTAISAPNCAAVVDSRSSSALTGFLSSLTASQISIVGNYSCFLCSFTPSPITGATALGDPLAYLTAPATACTGTPTAKNITTTGNFTVTPGSSCYDVNITAGANVTFNPGAYHSITVNAPPAAHPTLTFDAGLYTLWGSGSSSACAITYPCSLSLTGNLATLRTAPLVSNSGGVTFYIGPSAGSVQVDGIGNTISLQATTDSTVDSYPGVLFFQDRSNTNAACIGGCSGSISGLFTLMDVEGTMYFPKATVNFSGCCQFSSCDILVAYKVSLLLDYFADACVSLPGGSAVAHTALTE